MKATLAKQVVLSLIFFAINIALQAQPEWFRHFESDQFVSLSRISQAPDGSWYAIASFKGNTDFDPGPGAAILNADPNSFAVWNQFALLHLTENGELIWVKPFDTFGNFCFFNTITFSSQGDLILTGYFQFQFDAEPGPGETLLTSNNNAPGDQGFLLRLNSNGDLMNAAHFRGLGASSDCKPSNIVIASSNETYVAMNIAGDVDIDPSDEVVEVSTQDGPGGLTEMLLVKLNNEDSLLWYRKWAPTSIASCKLQTVEVDNNDNVYVGGFIHQTIDLNPGDDTVWVEANRDPVIISLNADGEYLWSRVFHGPTGLKSITEIQLYSDSLLFTGYFNDILNMDTSANPLQFVSNGQQDIFLGMMDLQGNLGWAKAFGSSGPEETFSTQITQDELVISGFFNAPLDFDPGVSNLTQNPVGNFDLFVLSLNHSGEFQRLYTRGSPALDFASFGRTEGPYYLIAGVTDSTLALNAGPAEATIVSAAGRDAFFARFIPAEVTVVPTPEPDNFKLFPNPSQGLIHISGLKTPAQIRIYDTSGRCAAHFSYEVNHPISIDHLLSGAYILEAETQSQRMFQRIIIR